MDSITHPAKAESSDISQSHSVCTHTRPTAHSRTGSFSHPRKVNTPAREKFRGFVFHPKHHLQIRRARIAETLRPRSQLTCASTEGYPADQKHLPLCIGSRSSLPFILSSPQRPRPHPWIPASIVPALVFRRLPRFFFQPPRPLVSPDIAQSGKYAGSRDQEARRACAVADPQIRVPG